MSTPTNPGSIVVHLHELALHLEENGFLQVEGIASIETLLTLTDEEAYALYLFFRHTRCSSAGTTGISGRTASAALLGRGNEGRDESVVQHDKEQR